MLPSVVLLSCIFLTVQPGAQAQSGHGEPAIYINPEINCGGTVRLCPSLGTAGNPAFSCQHLKDACDKPSGSYYVRSAGIFTKVYCEMELSGGGWARYGKADMADVWRYVEENEAEVTLEIISPSDVKEMITLEYNQFLVQTDVTFALQGDDSVNPSRLTTRTIPWVQEREVYIQEYANNHTGLRFATGSVDKIFCVHVNTSKCGQGGTPAANKESKRFFFQSLYFGPRAAGASTRGDQWNRNKYSWNGSFYYVYAK